jgi:polysaccharide biosynthesis/export protein
MKSASTAANLRWAALAFALTALTALMASISSIAQQPAPQPANPTSTSSLQSSGPALNTVPSNEPVLTLRDQKALENFEPPANEEYTLGAGDEISLDFPGRPELASKKTVGPDGMITLSLVGPVHVADLTRAAASDAIIKALSKYFTNLAVTVSIDKYSSNRVRVLGYVEHPGEIFFESTPTLLDAIGKAGLISPLVTANGTATNVGPGIPETCTIYRGNDTAVQVQLRKLLVSGNVLADMRLRRNDIVFVPQPKELFVSVLGEVAKPGTVPLTPDSTLTSVLAEAGCCAESGGFNPKIHILQPATGKDFTIDYKKVMTLSGQQEFTLHSGDVILVPKSGLYKATYLLQRISPVATLVSLAAIVGAG